MPGITNPAEEYFKDGSWGWDATAGAWVKLLVDAAGKLIVTVEEKVYAHFQTNAEQEFANGDLDIVNFEDEVYDPSGFVTTGAAWKFLPDVQGYYHLSTAIMFASSVNWADAELAYLAVYKNGVLFEYLQYKDNISASSRYMVLHGATDIYLDGATDYIDIRLYQGSGGALKLNASGVANFVAIHKI